MVLVLSENDVCQTISTADSVRLVEQSMGQYAAGETMLLPRMSLDLPNGGGAFRVMSAAMPMLHTFGLKTLTGFPGKRVKGETYFVLLLFSTESGALRAVIAAEYLTGLRTGAATGVAAKYLARENASVLGIFGAGAQAKYQVAALNAVRPLTEVKVFTRNQERAKDFAAELSNEFDVPAHVAATSRETVAGSDLVVTATTAREPVFQGEWLAPGTHVSGIGANTPVKRELDNHTFLRSKLVVDFKKQALAEAGDLKEALETGAISADHVYAELGELVIGKKQGRANDQEVTTFKSVGVAIQDIATAAYVYEQAKIKGLGTRLCLTAR
jgi:alanine dehydrogenase